MHVIKYHHNTWSKTSHACILLFKIITTWFRRCLQEKMRRIQNHCVLLSDHSNQYLIIVSKYIRLYTKVWLWKCVCISQCICCIHVMTPGVLGVYWTFKILTPEVLQEAPWVMCNFFQLDPRGWVSNYSTHGQSLDFGGEATRMRAATLTILTVGVQLSSFRPWRGYSPYNKSRSWGSLRAQGKWPFTPYWF